MSVYTSLFKYCIYIFFFYQNCMKIAKTITITTFPMLGLYVRPEYICIQRVFFIRLYNFQTIKLLYIMACLYHLLLFFLASSVVNRHNLSDAHFRYMSHIGDRLCFQQPKTVVNSPTFTLKLPCLYMCTNRRLRFLPISKLNFCTATLILLAGSDFIRMATLNVRSLTSKCASFSDLVLSKKLDVVV